MDRRKDGYAQHFMEETAAFSFEGMDGASDEYGPEFGSCGESENTYNDTAQENEFMGPVLWATDLDIFAEQISPRTQIDLHQNADIMKNTG